MNDIPAKGPERAVNTVPVIYSAIAAGVALTAKKNERANRHEVIEEREGCKMQ
jgi:hypothetical protein